jgi:hypothetical protein
MRDKCEMSCDEKKEGKQDMKDRIEEEGGKMEYEEKNEPLSAEENKEMHNVAVFFSLQFWC